MSCHLGGDASTFCYLILKEVCLIFIAELIDEKRTAAKINALDILMLDDCVVEIREWLLSDFWDATEVYRLAGEFADLLFDEHGHIEFHDYDLLRAALIVFPRVEDEFLLDLIEDAMPEDVVIDEESYAHFLCWLYQAEIAIAPGDPHRVFEFALAIGPVEATDEFLANDSILSDFNRHEILLNLVRNDLAVYCPEIFAEFVAEADQDTVREVTLILLDKICFLEDDLDEAAVIILQIEDCDADFDEEDSAEPAPEDHA